MTKVLVIGGGPGGLWAAIESKLKGFHVTLMEKGKIGENIRCAEGFYDTMKILEKPEHGICFSVEEIIVEAKSTHRIDAKPLNIWMIDRSKWQKSLGKKARDLGVNIKQDTKVEPEDLQKFKKDYDFIIDASGAPSVTSRVYGFSNFYKEHSGKTVQYLIEGDFSHIGKCIKVGLLPNFWGYYWIFPKGNDLANVGVGNFKPDQEEKLWDRLDKAMKKEGVLGNNYRSIKRTGGICPNKMPPKLKYDNIFLVGDAAGLTSPLHGGGIDTALISAKESIKAVTHNPDQYEESIRKTLYKKFQFEELLTLAWRQRDLDEMDYLISNIEKYKIYKLFTNYKLINDLSIKGLEKILLKTNPAM